MLAACTKLRNAEKVKQFLIKKETLDNSYNLVKEMDYIYFPLTKKMKVPDAEVVNTKFSFPKREESISAESILKEELTPKQMELLPKSQEIIGEIMILEIPEQLQKKEKVIAEAYLKANRHVQTVVKKQEMHSGVFRTRKVKILAGKRNKETVHRENGVQMKLHLEKTYFSAKLVGERLRIARQVKEGEEVLVMFSGAAPYPLVIAKNSPAEHVYGIEINPLAHQYAVQNVALNGLNGRISIFLGDVRDMIPKINKKIDRIVMPLPKTGEQFLDTAFIAAKKRSVIHLYSFLNENEISEHAQKIKELCRKLKHDIKVLRKVKCGQFSPGTFRVCFDLLVLE
ncbi:MAG: class I SAM-dependent methyltransferase family protein [Nanoarchaeota archaeon]